MLYAAYWHEGPSFPPSEKKKFHSIYRGDERQSVGFSSESEDNISNTNDF
jgi:hypothetical protein